MQAKRIRGDPASGHASEASVGKRKVGGYLIFLPSLGPAGEVCLFSCIRKIVYLVNSPLITRLNRVIIFRLIL